MGVDGALAAVVIFAALILSLAGGWLIVRLILWAAKVPEQPADTVSAPGVGTVPLLTEEEKNTSGALRGGTWIGFLERFAITGALLVNQGSFIAVIVAIKGLGRWADLRDNPEATERFIIGTLASIIWASLCGLGAYWLIR